MSVPKTRTTTQASPRNRQELDSWQHQVATTWQQRGCRVIPCSGITKGALVKGHKITDDTTRFGSAEWVAETWGPGGTHQGAHVGLLCGASGLIAVDIDTKPLLETDQGSWVGCADGYDVWAEIMRKAGVAWPETYQVATPGGGIHLIWQMPPGDPVGCAVGTKGQAALGPSIDVKGLGGYVIAAGSYSPYQGLAYRRQGDCQQPAPMPAWLVELLRPKSRDPYGAPTAHSLPAAPSQQSAGAARRADGQPAEEPLTCLPPQRRLSEASKPRVRDGYVQAAIAGEVARVRAVPAKAGSNWGSEVYGAAHALGSLVGAGLLDQAEAVQLLADAALSGPHVEGRTRARAETNITNGLKAGAAKPRKIGGAA